MVLDTVALVSDTVVLELFDIVSVAAVGGVLD